MFLLNVMGGFGLFYLLVCTKKEAYSLKFEKQQFQGRR